MAAPAQRARRLVLNGLTAEVGEGAEEEEEEEGGGDQEHYHELELYRQLLALGGGRGARRARTPEPAPPPREPAPRRSRTPGPPRGPPHGPTPPRAARSARYLGSFPVRGGAARGLLSDQLQHMQERGCAVPVLVVVALSGVQVCDPEDQSVRMSHATRRILFATCESARQLFALVAREPRHDVQRDVQHDVQHDVNHDAPQQYCHAFETDSPEQAEELNTLVGDAFRMAFASQLQPSAPLWCKELSGGERGGARAPDSLPGLAPRYPPCGDSSPVRCGSMGLSRLQPGSEPSPSSSEESHSPTELHCYRRLGERAPLMRRLALGLSGALLQPSDDDSTPLVADTPTTPTNPPLCLSGGGYVNEASEAEARTRESNRDSAPHTPRRHQSDREVDFRKCGINNVKHSSPSANCSRTTSSSSGASSCGGGAPGSLGSGNNNNNSAPRVEPALRQAPWFQHGIPREIALEVLSGQAVGAFLVRGSTTQAGCYALSVRVPRDFQPSGIAHYLILRTPKGYKIKGFTKEFTSLSALVTHHSVMPELLPVPLLLARGPGAGGGGGPGAAGGPARREHADIDAVAPPPRRLAHHHVAHFLAQLDV